MARIVWDAPGARTYVLDRSGPPRMLSGEVGRIAVALRAGGPAAAAVRAQLPRAVVAIDAAGWSAPSATVREVPADPHLKRVQVEVSLRCNLSCAYCYSMSGPGRAEALGRDQILDLVDQADRIGALEMDFTGGELLLDPDWTSYVERARAAGIRVTVHTNGTTIREPQAETLRRLGVAAVQVSLDSHLPEIHDASRGHRGALTRTLRGLDVLQELGLPIRLSVMAHRDNVGTLGDTIRFMTSRYPSASLNVDRVIATGGGIETGTGLSGAEFYEFLQPYLGGTVRAGKVCESPTEEDYAPECGMAYSYVYVTAEGEIASCPTMTGREDERFRGPSMTATTLADAWYTSSFFTSFRHTNCENVTRCPAGTSCGGGCRSNAYVESGGSVTAPDVVACNLRKNAGPVFVDFPRRYAQGEFTAVG